MFQVGSLLHQTRVAAKLICEVAGGARSCALTQTNRLVLLNQATGTIKDMTIS